MHKTQNYNFSIRNGISDLNDCCCEATFTLLMAIYSLSHKFPLPGSQYFLKQSTFIPAVFLS